MSNDFSGLSPTEFESLARDLIGSEMGVRFEAFAEGPDDGIDGRYAAADGQIILQVKHFLRSPFSTLKSKMSKERQSIDQLGSHRYVFATSTPLTPGNKSGLANVIGPSLQSTGDIFGPDDLRALLRKFPEIEKSHPSLWSQSAAVMEHIFETALEKSKAKSVPESLAALLPSPSKTSGETGLAARDVIFLIKSSPIDDEFALWLAPKLEAAGYKVFADILTLEPGDRWRQEIQIALQHRAVKILLISRAETLADRSVQDDIDSAIELGEALNDPRFIIPLRLGQAPKVKGVGDVTVDFIRGWGEGLAKLIEALQRQRVPRQTENIAINPNWDAFRRRGSIPIIDQPERLTSNWLRIVEAPDKIHYYEGSGSGNLSALKAAIGAFPYPASLQGRGFVTFADQDEVDELLKFVGRFKIAHQWGILDFVEHGAPEIKMTPQTASNLVVAMANDAWQAFCRNNGFVEHEYSHSTGYHASPEQAAVGQRIPWGQQGKKRSSMLRNVAKGHIWQYGITATPQLWPFWHFKLKSRVLFAVDNASPAGIAIDDAKKLHRLRRSICKGWRNKQWHGRLLAFLELLSGESAFIRLAMSEAHHLVLDASPILFTSPVSTALPDELDADEEETDLSTLGRPEEDVEVESEIS